METQTKTSSTSNFPVSTTRVALQPPVRNVNSPYTSNERSNLLKSQRGALSEGPKSPAGSRRYVISSPKRENKSDSIIKADGIEEEEGNPPQDGKFLAMIFVVYVLLALLNRLFQKLQTYPMYNYPIFLNQFGIFSYIPLCFLYIIPMVKWGSAISKVSE